MSGLAKVDATTRTVNGDINGNPSDAIISREAQIAKAALAQSERRKESSKDLSSWSWAISGFVFILSMGAFFWGTSSGKNDVLDKLPPDVKDAASKQLDEIEAARTDSIREYLFD
jgi:hypothetical protein